MMQKENLDTIVLKKLQLDTPQEPKLDKWKSFLDKQAYAKNSIRIGLVGKYVELQDAYKSILESFIETFLL